MRSRVLVALVAAVGLAAGIFGVTAQEPGDDVRGAFLESRPKTTNPNAPSRRNRRRPARANANVSASSSPDPIANVNFSNTGTTTVRKSAPAIGLGYTVFMRDDDGRGVRVEPTREFRNGDRIRLALEPNVDGYIYIFDSEDGAPPRMIYPDARLDNGENWFEAHVPLEIPSSEENDERLRWFEFYGKPSTDRIYIVLTREPLKSVPTGAELVTFCSANKDKCPWAPPDEVWSQIQNATKAQVKVVTSKTFGQPQHEKEKIASTRGLGLDKSAPQPSVIRMNASSNELLLVAVLDMVHK